MPAYTYILLCSNNSFYTGSTKNLQLRIEKHKNGKGANHTAKYSPVQLVYFEEHAHVGLAFKREKQIQGWSRAKKLALIEGEYDQLQILAKNRMYPLYRINKEFFDKS